MDDLISRAAAIAWFFRPYSNEEYYSNLDVERALKAIPAVDAIPVERLMDIVNRGEIMAEYNDVIKQFKRMCQYYSRDKVQKSCPMCTSYPNCNIGQCRKIAFEKPAHFAAVVMRWAAEHPEPVYPTWWKYMCMTGVIPEMLGNKTLSEVAMESLMKTHIPSDIAEKLGIEPKE